MLVIGFAVVWAGYGVSSWAYLVLRGYDVPFVAWFTPGRGVFDWSQGVGAIPDTQVWPSAGVQQVGNAQQSTAGRQPAVNSQPSVFNEPGVPGINASKGR